MARMPTDGIANTQTRRDAGTRPVRGRVRARGAARSWTTKVFGTNSFATDAHTLVLKQVELLLAEGRAVGNKELSEYLEVRGYANAADWVYGRAIEPGTWSDGGA